MTDRHKGYIVILEENIREDDAEKTVLAALRQIKGVQQVLPQLAQGMDGIAVERAKMELKRELYAFIEKL